MPRCRIYLLLTLLLGAGCAGGGMKHASPPQGGELVGTTWRLAAPGEELSGEMDGARITAAFTDEGRVGGSAGCNRYFGTYVSMGGELAISEIGATRRMCAPPVMDLERRFLSTLESVARWERHGDRLDLLDGNGRRLLRFVEPGTDAPAASEGDTFVVECPGSGGGGFSFTMRTGPEEPALWLPEQFDRRYRALEQVDADAGARYEGDGVVAVLRGEEVGLRVGERTFTGCTRDVLASVWEAARRGGVDFRAVGQEPGWYLEIDEGKAIRFVYDYGQEQVTAPATDPVLDPEAGRTVYRAEADRGDLTVAVRSEPCTDTMSGEAFETTVTVTFDGRTYHGCGRTLR